MDHEDTDAAGDGAFGGFDAPGRVNEQAALAAARRRPELHDLDALFQEAVKQGVSGFVRLVGGLLADRAVEAEGVAKARP